MDDEIWAGGEKIDDWAHSGLPEVGDTIVVVVDGKDSEAEVAKVGTFWDKFGAKKTRIEVQWSNPMVFIT